MFIFLSRSDFTERLRVDFWLNEAVADVAAPQEPQPRRFCPNQKQTVISTRNLSDQASTTEQGKPKLAQPGQQLIKGINK